MGIEKKQSIQLEEICSKNRASESKGADFETAVTTCGYGKFHYLLFLAVIPASWASVLDSSNMSMILPSAECDLQLSLFHKGILNGITYAGMVSSALIWGFIADVMGRRRILVYGFFADGICNILCGLSQNFATIVFFKFMSGFIISGPYATIMTYCAEFYCTKDRPRVTLAVGFTCFAGCIVNAALAWIIIPQNWHFEVGDNAFVYNSWRIYITSCGIPILIGALGLTFFPESPKFLMSQGRNEEALEVFKTMYAVNNGVSKDTYPIKLLENELIDQNGKQKEIVEQMGGTVLKPKSLKIVISDGFLQMKPLFMGSYFARLFLVVLVQCGGMLCANTLRLWQPQLFATLNNFQNGTSGGLNFTFCEILDNSTSNLPKPISLDANLTKSVVCTVKPVDNSVYMFTILVSTTTNVCLFLAAALVNLVGNKNLLLICFVLSTCAVLVLNWASHYTFIIVLTSLFVGLMCTTTNLVISVTVNLFPTSLRTMAVSLAMMIGRIGALAGNITFPVLLDSGCFVAIAALAVILIVSAVLTLFIPKHKENVK
ncbi:synaptic vesicle glycoprotein 2B-like [Nasonia vitripennis]|uniref:Major facilitator superfamily (MFS) profile domain-containing protein n=1 Tax=Nasonia vitripennis TaxID=7425 RepID=A0A7M7IS62_NASVI|nr:synaptic vesicle glycoprotein 2B-like [Nasonia vitripennis]